MVYIEVTYRPPGGEQITRLLERNGKPREFPSRMVAEHYTRAVNAMGAKTRVVER